MPFTTKDWKNSPDATTPLSATALEDLEDRLSDYADSVAAGGIELGSATITSNATSTANILSETDVAGLSVTVTVASRPIIIIFSADQIFNTNATENAFVVIKESTTRLATLTHAGSAASEGSPACRVVRLAPSSGSHTYKVALARLSAGTATIGASATSPALLQVIEV